MPFLCSYTKIYPGLEFGNELITIYYNKVFCLSLGDMDMKKMNSPKLEIIQFNTEDVIVTSGGGASSITKGFLADNWYFTLGREIEQADLAKFEFNSDRKKYYFFHAVKDVDTFQYNYNSRDSNVERVGDPTRPCYYSWFNDTDGWQTQMETYQYYLNGNGFTD